MDGHLYWRTAIVNIPFQLKHTSDSSVLMKLVKEGSLKLMLDVAQDRRIKRLNAAF